MSGPNRFRHFWTQPEIIRLAVMMSVRFPLSLRNVEDLLHERGTEISHESVRFWWSRFGPMFAAARSPADIHFSVERSLSSQDVFNSRRTGAPAEWRQLAAA